MALNEVVPTAAGLPSTTEVDATRSHLKITDILWVVGLTIALPLLIGMIYGLYLSTQGYTPAGVEDHFALPEVESIASIVGLALVAFIPVLLICAFAWRRGVALADFGFCASERRYFFYAIVGLGFLTAVGYGLIPFIDETELERLGRANDDLVSQGGQLFILTMVFLIVLIPFAEEVFFRGAVYNALVKYMPSYVAAFLGSGLFALGHTQYLLLGGQAAAFGLFQIFLLGMVLSWLFIKSKSVWPPVFLHILNNAFAFISVIYLS